MVEKLDHGAYTVSDMDKSLAFYRDLFGMKVKMDFEAFGPEWDAWLGKPNVRFRIVYFEQNVELIQWISPSVGKPMSASPFDFGYTTLIFNVDNLPKMYEELPAKGVKFHAPPRVPQHEVPGVGKVMVAHVAGPDGELVILHDYHSI
jgi:glyoxylase I family protein